MSIKDWVFVAGTILIAVDAVGEILDRPQGFRKLNEAERTSGIHAGYVYGVIAWLCVVNFFDWRRGLASLGMYDVLSWVLAPIGLLLLLVFILIGWWTTYAEEAKATKWDNWLVWAGTLVLDLAGVAAYLAVVRLAGKR
jgi:hypothetical protein